VRCRADGFPARRYRATVATIQHAPAVNRLLAGLPRTELRRILPGFETVQLAFAEVLHAPSRRLRHVYFPISSCISMVMPIDDSSCLEVGLIGDEGVFGIPLVFGIDVSTVRAVVQGPGSALRMDATSFRRELARSEALQQTIHRYVWVHMSQLARTAGCIRFHVLQARLARWLLMTQDRAHSDEFHVTHEFLALMLGVRRVSVTKAASELQQRNLIRYRRGNITVLDRRGLKSASCGCYSADLASYDRILT
jgi:CRP-like cAMP-binding protein